ncbi:hypothetical protein HK102_006503 [Quaeritorhiza haematococci]|nr:hypothetical protein HK102_006503 [Quaeritorhiza haematococci]
MFRRTSLVSLLLPLFFINLLTPSLAQPCTRLIDNFSSTTRNGVTGGSAGGTAAFSVSNNQLTISSSVAGSYWFTQLSTTGCSDITPFTFVTLKGRSTISGVSLTFSVGIDYSNSACSSKENTVWFSPVTISGTTVQTYTVAIGGMLDPLKARARAIVFAGFRSSSTTQAAQAIISDLQFERACTTTTTSTPTPTTTTTTTASPTPTATNTGVPSFACPTPFVINTFAFADRGNQLGGLSGPVSLSSFSVQDNTLSAVASVANGYWWNNFYPNSETTGPCLDITGYTHVTFEASASVAGSRVDVGFDFFNGCTGTKTIAGTQSITGPALGTSLQEYAVVIPGGTTFTTSQKQRIKAILLRFASAGVTYRFRNLRMRTLSAPCPVPPSRLQLGPAPVVLNCVQPGMFAMTFDDGPTTNWNILLQTLASKNVKATFFINGDNRNQLTDPAIQSIVTQSFRAGHQIASHGYFHYSSTNELNEFTTETNIRQLDDLIFSFLNVRPTFFRPPYGDYDAGTQRAIGRAGYRHLVYWTIDPRDWDTVNNADAILQGFRNVLEPADSRTSSFVALQHDWRIESVNQVGTIVDYVRSKGYSGGLIKDIAMHPLAVLLSIFGCIAFVIPPSFAQTCTIPIDDFSSATRNGVTGGSAGGTAAFSVSNNQLTISSSVAGSYWFTQLTTSGCSNIKSFTSLTLKAQAAVSAASLIFSVGIDYQDSACSRKEGTVWLSPVTISATTGETYTVSLAGVADSFKARASAVVFAGFKSSSGSQAGQAVITDLKFEGECPPTEITTLKDVPSFACSNPFVINTFMFADRSNQLGGLSGPVDLSSLSVQDSTLSVVASTANGYWWNNFYPDSENSPCLDITGYTHVTFEAAASVAGSRVDIGFDYFNTCSGSKRIAGTQTITGPELDTSFQEYAVVIPGGTFTTSQKQRVKAILLRFASGGVTYRFRNLRMRTLDVPCPVPPSRLQMAPAAAVQSCVQPGMFALTFDDGPTLNWVDLLRTLASKNAKVTFFVNGDNESRLTDPNIQSLVLRAYRAGHQIASHGYYHYSSTNQLNEFTTETNIRQLDDLFFSFLNVRPTFFRPPYGEYDAGTQRALGRAGYKYLVYWNFDPRDWVKTNPGEEIVKAFRNVLDRADPRTSSFVSLQHDWRRESVDNVGFIVDYVRSKGYRLVTMAECLGETQNGGYL